MAGGPWQSLFDLCSPPLAADLISARDATMTVIRWLLDSEL